MRNRWDEYFMKIAADVSSQTRCLSRHIGAVIVRDGKFIVSTGYNGPAICVAPCWERREIKNIYASQFGKMPDHDYSICPRRVFGYESGEGLYWCAACHAERNAIDIAARLGISTKDCILYLNTEVCPCLECAKSIIQAGIIEVVVIDDQPYEKYGISGKLMLEYGKVKVRTC